MTSESDGETLDKAKVKSLSSHLSSIFQTQSLLLIIEFNEINILIHI